MIDFLVRRFVKGWQDTADPQVRERYGVFSGIVGILLNLALFGGKFLAGFLTGAISVTADAFNNLSDAASSVVTLIGFRLAGQKADREHPFGHGRIEYLAGLLVSLLILLVGVELARSSADKILHPQAVAFSLLSFLILVLSIAVKLWMGFFNKNLGRRIGSAAMAATATDSLTDAAATGAVLAGLAVSHFWNLKIDGWIGLLVAVFILKAGFSAAKETLNPLLGQPPEPGLVREIEQLILSHSQIVGVHDLVIHDYGPGRRMMSAHAEVDAKADIMEAHDIIDHVERELGAKFHLESVLHMDPVIQGDGEVMALRDKMSAYAKEIHPSLTIHDFRVTAGPLHTNLIFDVVAPYDFKCSDEELKEALAQKAQQLEGQYYTVIQVDRTYVR